MYNSNIHQQAIAKIQGSKLYPTISGEVYFRDIPTGVMIFATISGLPAFKPSINNEDPIGPHGFHIHNIGTCEDSNSSNAFLSAGEHFNPNNQPHGNHAGDLPVLFSNDGIAIMSFFTNKFTVKDIIGKSVIIHQNPDDYRSQPSGKSGTRIACGIIYSL